MSAKTPARTQQKALPEVPQPSPSTMALPQLPLSQHVHHVPRRSSLNTAPFNNNNNNMMATPGGPPSNVINNNTMIAGSNRPKIFAAMEGGGGGVNPSAIRYHPNDPANVLNKYKKPPPPTPPGLRTPPSTPGTPPRRPSMSTSTPSPALYHNHYQASPHQQGRELIAAASSPRKHPFTSSFERN
jgi:hypothetical protein